MNTKTIAAARIFLGLVFFVFGLNGLLQLFPQPQMEGRAAAFIGALVASGYVFPLLFTIYLLAGAALLSNRFVPLALILLAPAIVNIVAVHFFLAPAGLAPALVVLGLEVFLAWSHRAAFRPLLRARPEAAAPTALGTTGTTVTAHAS